MLGTNSLAGFPRFGKMREAQQVGKDKAVVIGMQLGMQRVFKWELTSLCLKIQVKIFCWRQKG